MNQFDPEENERVAIVRIRRYRKMTVEELLEHHDQALRSVFQCMAAAENARVKAEQD